MIKNIILDIDETLIHTEMQPKNKPYFTITVAGTKYFVTPRPGLKEFLDYIFKRFKTVNIWTAATREYAYLIMSHILNKKQQSQLRFFNTREHTHMGAKPLSLIFNGELAKKHNVCEHNTIIIDDRMDVSRFNLGNAIIVPPWLGSGHDDYLYKLMIILDGILSKKIVTKPNDRPIILKQITD